LIIQSLPTFWAGSFPLWMSCQTLCLLIPSLAATSLLVIKATFLLAISISIMLPPPEIQRPSDLPPSDLPPSSQYLTSQRHGDRRLTRQPSSSRRTSSQRHGD